MKTKECYNCRYFRYTTSSNGGYCTKQMRVTKEVSLCDDFNDKTMKKILICLTLAIAGMMATGCSSCQSGNEKQDNQESAYHDYDGVVQDFTAGTSHIQALHRQSMYRIIWNLQAEGHEIALNGKYQWRNSLVILNDTVTAENIEDLHVVSIRDVFFYWDNRRCNTLPTT